MESERPQLWEWGVELVQSESVQPWAALGEGFPRRVPPVPVIPPTSSAVQLCRVAGNCSFQRTRRSPIWAADSDDPGTKAWKREWWKRVGLYLSSSEEKLWSLGAAYRYCMSRVVEVCLPFLGPVIRNNASTLIKLDSYKMVHGVSYRSKTARKQWLGWRISPLTDGDRLRCGTPDRDTPA
jgi:hypothetical protein